MARMPMNERAFDDAEYARAEEQFRRVREHLPEVAVKELSREVVKRLAFRMPKVTHRPDFPTSDEIDKLCAALLSGDRIAADNLIIEARQDGVEVETIYISFLAAAARRLGEKWDADEITFVDVTLACGKLFGIMRGLRHLMAPSIHADRIERPAMFALVPGETHTVGIGIATDIFRRKGWEIDMMVGLDHDTLLKRSDERYYRAIIVVANTDDLLDRVARLVLALRISHPLTHIFVAGNILDHYPEIEGVVGADGVIKDIEEGVALLEEIVELPA